MKTTLINLFVFLAMLVSVNSYSQTDNADNGSGTSMVTDGPSLYVVVQRSAMCEMCDNNYDRWNKEIVSYYSGRPSIIFMNYDITNSKTIEESRADIDKYELYEMLNVNNRPGRVFLIDPANKQILKMMDIDMSTVDFRNAITEAAPMKEKSTSKEIK